MLLFYLISPDFLAGYLFPKTVSTTFEAFITDAMETAKTLKDGMFINPLIYDFSRVGNHNTLADFVCGMPNRDHVLDKDENAIRFYEFFFEKLHPATQSWKY